MARTNADLLVGRFRPRRFPLGAGGWVVNADVADDGTLVCGTDTYNAMILKPGQRIWRDLFRPGITTRYDQPGRVNGGGCSTIAIQATNSDVLYGVWDWNPWKSTNGGLSWEVVPGFGGWGPGIDFNANHQFMKHFSPNSAIDPVNADVWAVGTSEGFHITRDGGQSATRMAGLPAPAANTRILVAFDRTSPVANGRTQGLYIFVPGAGLHRSDDGGVTATLVSGSPVMASDMAVRRGTGHVFLCGNGPREDGSPIRRYIPAAGWTTLSGFASSLALHPTEPKLWGIQSSGEIFYSPDNGDTFPVIIGLSHRRRADDIPWLGFCAEGYMSNGVVKYRPNDGTLAYFEGIGAWRMSNPSNITPASVWYSISEGIDQLCIQDLRTIYAPSHPAHDRLLVTAQDRPFFVFDANKTSDFPYRQGPGQSIVLSNGGTQDWASENPDFMVGSCGKFSGGADFDRPMWYTRDGGKSWSRFPVDPPGWNAGTGVFSGCVAVTGVGKGVWMPSNKNAPMWFELDTGEWGYVEINGGPVLNQQGLHQQQILVQRRLVSDKLNPGHAYLYLVADDMSYRGIWKNTNHGRGPWTRIKTGYISGDDYWNSHFHQNYAKPGHWFFTGGDSGGSEGQSDTFSFSPDNMVTWHKLPGFTECFDIAIGKAGTGETYESIYVHGFYNGEEGYFRIANFDPATRTGSVTKIGTFSPNGHSDRALSLAATMDTFGTLYSSSGGSGIEEFRYEAPALGMAA